jgi:protein SCO1/2
MRGNPALAHPELGRPTQHHGPRLLHRGGGQFLLVLGAATVALVGLSVMRGLSPRGQVEPTPNLAAFLVPEVKAAPPIELIDARAKPFTLESLRGTGVLVFFGYTHCPDVCPATIGIVGQVLASVGPGVRAVFVTVDPARDTPASLAEYVKYLPEGFAALTGSAAQIRTAADAWGVRYARVDASKPETYSMTHTASVYLVDQAGLLRAEFPFGTQPEPMSEVVRDVLATPIATATPPTAPPPPTATPKPVAPTAGAATPGASLAPTANPIPDLRAEVVSSAVWAGGRSPVILALLDASGRLNDLGARVEVRLISSDGVPAGPALVAIPVQPFGLTEVSYVATLDIPSPGWWGLSVAVQRAGAAGTASTKVAVLDPGATTVLGGEAPAVRTPTLADVGGYAREITTDPAPDLRLSATSTVDALAGHETFVLVIDSTKFRTSPACGKALVMARYLQDRWREVPFIHLEPFEYDVVTDTPVLVGTLSAPTLVAAASAWGIGGPPWGVTSMPWVFVVDGNGVVRAKYQGVIGSADIDVIIAMVLAGG